MARYKEKNKKENLITIILGEIIFVFVIATASIILYDMYINIDVAEDKGYEAKKTAQEIENSENTMSYDISDVLENASKSVVRNI